MLDHPWLSDATCRTPRTLNEQEAKDLQKNLCSFANAPPPKKTVLSLLVGTRTHTTDLDSLKKPFIKLDRDQDGFLTIDDLKFAFKGIADDSPTPLNIATVFNALDLDQDGRLDYAEFLQAAADPSRLATQQNLEELFKVMDMDGDGRIARRDLAGAMASEGGRDGGRSWD